MGDQEPDEETIQRRSENSETALGCLSDIVVEAIGCAWILSICAGVTLLPMGMMILR